MKISAITAIKLVKSLNDIVTNHIGIIDLNGTILAHTNQQLAGSYSKAAIDLYNTGGELRIISDLESNADEIPGVYSVIEVNKKLCGVLLVQFGTQPPEELMQICELIQRICVHTIIEAMSSDYYNIKNYDRNLFLTDWLKDSYHESRTEFSKRAAEYHIKPEAGVTAAILRIYHIAFNHTLFYDVFDWLTGSGFFVLEDDNGFILIFNATDRGVLSSQIDRIEEYLCERAPNHLLTVGSPQRNCTKARESYSIAKLMQTSFYGKQTGVLYFDNCILNLCFEEVPQHYKETFVNNVFGNCSPKDVAGYCAFIDIYFSSNGSLKAIAEKLFTHANTVQYRIERIRQKTGLDLRNYSEAFQLYMAALWSNQTSSAPMQTNLFSKN